MANVLLLENVHPTAHEMLRAEGHTVTSATSSLPASELRARVADIDVLGIRSKTQVAADILAGAPHLLAVGAFCIGTNQVDLANANARGVPVFNAPFSNTRSVAELVIAEIVMLARQLGDRIREVHSGRWRKVAEGCYEVRGKTLGIVGYGHIGSQVGVLAEGMGMRVVYFDVASKLAMGNVRVCATLVELLGEADFVTLHVPATEQTDGMIGPAQFAAMKRGSFVLNASRGNVVGIAALAAALRSHHLAGAAIDVYPDEPEGQTDAFRTELQDLPNVILTPHIGGSTSEAQAAIGREVATSLIKYLKHGTTSGAVNFPQLELAPTAGTHRIVNVHKNVPGVLRDINRIVSDHNANIHSQILGTDPQIGYLIMDLDEDVTTGVHHAMAELKTTIRARVLY